MRDIFLRLGLILGVALLAFAHPPLRAGGVDLAAYAMPDGTMPQLCGMDSTDQPAHTVHCPACHLAAEAALPLPALALIWTELPEGLPLQTAAQTPVVMRANAPPQSRAPPALTV